MDPYLAAYWWMLGIGGAGLLLLSLGGHLHLGHDMHIGDHGGGVDVGGGHAEIGHLGHGAEAHLGEHAEAHVGGHEAGGQGPDSAAGEMPFTFSFLSPFIVSTFVAFGGVTGLTLRCCGYNGPWTLPPALGGGLLMAWLTVSGLNWALTRSQGSTSFRGANIIGFEAAVITPIPAGGVGEIAFTVKSVRRTAAARSSDGAAIPRSTRVTIVDQQGAEYLVRPTTDEQLRLLDSSVPKPPEDGS